MITKMPKNSTVEVVARIFAALFFLAVAVFAQPNLVTVQEVITLPDGTPARGTVNITLNAACSAPPNSSFIYGGRTNPIKLDAAGRLTVTLVPNASCNPQTAYLVSYSLTNSSGVVMPRASETWYIPATPSPTTIQAIRTGLLPTPPITLNVSQLIGTLLGDVLYGNANSGVSRLPGNTSSTRKYLVQTGNDLISAAPSWEPLIAGAVAAGECLQTGENGLITSTGQPCGIPTINFSSILGYLNPVTQIEAANKQGSGSKLATTNGLTNSRCVETDSSGNLVSSADVCNTSVQVDNYSQTFTSQTSVNITHNTGKAAVLVACYDTNDAQVYPQDVDITNINTAVVTFEAAQSGKCVVNATGGSSGPGSGGASDFSELTGTLDPATQISSGDKQGNGAKVQMSTGTLTSGNCLQADANGNTVDAGAPCATGLANDYVSFTAQTSVTFNHNAGTLNILMECQNGSGDVIIPQSVNHTTNTSTITFKAAQTGRCVVNKTGGTGGNAPGGGGGGDVSSDTTSTTIDQLPLFANTGGKLLKAFTGSGLVKVVNGVVSVVTGTASDCVKVDTTSGACGTGGGGSVTPGMGLVSNGGILEADPDAILTFIEGSGLLNFPNLNGTGVCSSLSITGITGALPGDAIVLRRPHNTESGILLNATVSSADTVTIEACKVIASPTQIDMPERTFAFYIFKKF